MEKRGDLTQLPYSQCLIGCMISRVALGLVKRPMRALVVENFLGQPIVIPVSFSIFALLKTFSYAAQKQKYRKS